MGKITENLSVSFDLRMLGIILVISATAIWGYRDLMDEIELAKQLPTPGTGHYIIDESDPNAIKTWPPTKVEYIMKDQASRTAIEQLEIRVSELEDEIEELRGN